MPDCPSDEGNAVYSIPPHSESSNNQQPALSDLSPQDKPWDKHRSFADAVETLYRGSEFQNYSDRIHFCSEFLKFGLLSSEDDLPKLKLKAARFCRVRHCPICQWRRSLMWKAKAYKVLPRIVETYPSYRWIFLTLTQKNVSIKELKQTLQNMTKSFQRLSQLKNFPAVGWLRSTEVTRSSENEAHPHFHCLLMVSPGYFSGKNYLKQRDWVDMWKKSLRVTYTPIVNIRSIKQDNDVTALVPEILKYCTKESDLVVNKEWFFEFTKQMNGVRSISTGGILKEHLKELENEPNSLINNDSLSIQNSETSVYFEWKRKEKKYRMMSDRE